MQRVWSTYLDGHIRGRSSPHLMDFSLDASRPASVTSHATSAYSHAGSTRHMLSPSETGPLEPPNLPFANKTRLSATSSDANSLSLSVNYIPSKFSNTLLSPGGSSTRKRKNGKSSLDPIVPKQGGGIDAFKSGEARIGGLHDDDHIFGDGKSGPARRLRWNRFKWALFLGNTLLTGYSLVTLVFCLLTWFNVWHHADIVRVGNRSELVLSTLAGSFGLFTCVIGWAGILLNNRGFLATWTFFSWITFVFIITPGYLTYKRRTFNIEGKINAQWSRALGSDGRLRLQNQLGCCGYFSPFVEAIVSPTCYARSVLPGCKKPYMDWERKILERWYTVSFGLVPVHIGVIVIGLLCSNHVTYRFGKGMMPKAYRMSMNSMAVIMDNYANQLAEQYGSEVAERVMNRSRSNLQLDTMQTMSYNKPSPSTYHARYESVGTRAPEGIS